MLYLNEKDFSKLFYKDFFMPDGSYPLLIPIIILIIFSGFFSASETAVSCSSKIKLKTLSGNGNKRAANVLKFIEEKYDNIISTILIGNNIVNLSASALSTLFFAKVLYNFKIDSTLISTIVITVSVLIFGEIIPKFVAKIYPEKIAMFFYPELLIIFYILSPLNFLFSGWKFLCSKIFKIKSEDVITEDEIMTFVEEAEEDGTLKKDETELIRSVIEFDDLEVEDILTPRVNISAVEINSPLEEILKTFTKSGFSRVPVYKDSIDSIVGIIHEKDFYNFYVSKQGKLSDIIQEAYFTSQHAKISNLLKILQKKRLQMAIVLDEYGGTLGIITIEDILEELVGEIYDEHDEELSFHKVLKDGNMIIDGNMSLESCFSLLKIENEKEYDTNTVSGWIIEILGEIPTVGTEFEFENYKIRILKATVKKVLQILVQKNQKPEEE